MNTVKTQIKNFLKRTSTNLYDNDEVGCYHFNLDGGLFTLAVGWLGGYENKFDDNGLFKSKSQPTYCVNAGIFVRNDFDCADYEWLTIPWDKETGDCWDNSCSISKDTNFNELATFFLKEYQGLMEAYKNDELEMK